MQQVIALCDQLHIAVLDAVVHHLDIVAGAARSHVFHARLAVFGFGSNGAKNWRNSLPSFRLSAGHDRWPPQRAFFSARDSGTDIEKSLTFKRFVAAVGVEKGRIATIHEDVTRFQMWL